MQSFDMIITLLIVVAAGIYLIKRFFFGIGCCGCSCGCTEGSGKAGSGSTNGTVAGADESNGGKKIHSNCSGCNCAGE